MLLTKEKLNRIREIQEKIFELEEELKSIYNLQIKSESDKNGKEKTKYGVL